MENNLEEILKKQGRKYGWLADQVGLNRNTITNLIKGAEPKLKVAYKIAPCAKIVVVENIINYSLRQLS